MWHFLTSYIKYWFTAKTKYSIHSPFVYHLVSEVLAKKTPKEIRQKLDTYRMSLSKDTNQIHVTDFGAGSRVFTSNIRSVQAIAKYAGISRHKSDILQKLVAYFKPENILELGTSLGIGTAAMAIAYPNTQITSLEGCPETAKIANKYLSNFQFNSCRIIIGEFSAQLPKILSNQTFDLMYFDGNHQKEATIQYFESCLPQVHNNTLCIFDDIHWSKGMEEAWKYIIHHPRTTVCIDLYHVGLVFFRKEQEPQNFIIKI